MTTDETEDLKIRGMRCLMDNMGTIEAERFISAVLREKFDYTRWRREYFDGVTPEEFHAASVAWAKTTPGIETRYAPPLEAEEPAK